MSIVATRTVRLTSINSACDTSVRETAVNPPINVYVATAKSVKNDACGEIESKYLLQQL